MAESELLRLVDVQKIDDDIRLHAKLLEKE